MRSAFEFSIDWLCDDYRQMAVVFDGSRTSSSLTTWFAGDKSRCPVSAKKITCPTLCLQFPISRRTQRQLISHERDRHSRRPVGPSSDRDFGKVSAPSVFPRPKVSRFFGFVFSHEKNARLSLSIVFLVWTSGAFLGTAAWSCRLRLGKTARLARRPALTFLSDQRFSISTRPRRRRGRR